MDFNCVQDCSKCCIEREYYPTKKFGKVGVLILPEEKEIIEDHAKNLRLDIVILPRIGISYEKSDVPTEILAYQLMGKESNGNTCPFLDTESTERSPHGGYNCKIYKNRPLACRAYPVIDSSPVTLDNKCKFCENCATSVTNVNQELESLSKIKVKMQTKAPFIWRYATGIGEKLDTDKIETGWILEH
ncbi:MAG: YkgJ family cysteine cluster protein [Nitrosopumilaceae archaeon]